MTTHEAINDENAESVGTPILEKILHSFVYKDREALIQHFPYLHEWMTEEIFNEAVDALNRLGTLISTEYSNHSIKNENHLLSWNVHYRNDAKKVVWELFLIDHQREIRVNGFRFDR